ncbi:methionyl-tRNA formyltransferase [Flavobacterium sp.]|uniref:methionyl-tRNA formyltransferase n=1 Tax=Flavobacterium sp. TaxID=239 RepID=UPI00352803CE
MNKLRIVFMGTPDFAVGILDTIYQHNYEIVGVVTTADKPAGRGQKIHESAVKQYAVSKGLRVLQPTNLKSEEFLTELKSLNANLQVVVAFRMLPEVVWKMPQLGTFNLHASLLPNYRGAAPINWAIINGETQTGVTTFFIDDKIDTGEMILHKETPIQKNETVGELHNKLMLLGSEAVLETLTKIQNGNVKTQKQNDTTQLKAAPKLNKDNCKIDWTKPGIDIYNLIRGLNPYPAAWSFIEDNNNEWTVKFYDVDFIPENHFHAIGAVIATKKELKIAVTDGYIQVKSLQFPGKRKMKSNELLNGINFSKKALAK